MLLKSNQRKEWCVKQIHHDDTIAVNLLNDTYPTTTFLKFSTILVRRHEDYMKAAVVCFDPGPWCMNLSIRFPHGDSNRIEIVVSNEYIVSWPLHLIAAAKVTRRTTFTALFLLPIHLLLNQAPCFFECRTHFLFPSFQRLLPKREYLGATWWCTWIWLFWQIYRRGFLFANLQLNHDTGRGSESISVNQQEEIDSK